MSASQSMERITNLAITTLYCLLLDSATATSFEKLAIGDTFENVMKDPPPNVLAVGDCIEYKFPRIMRELKWGYIETEREGVMEACMRENCTLEVGERGFSPPNWISDTEGQGTDCFLKLQDAGGLAIMKGDASNPVLLQTLWQNANLTVYTSPNTVAYEVYLEDLYEVVSDHALEYGPDRFSKNPSLVLRRVVWTWLFDDNFTVKNTVLATLPETNLPNLNAD
ncbi:hypothetical protein Mapa_005012 [Marchantia paleacea]|nr:hypothetical protein Mapa_005012 [Marchantia paleacea]